MVVVAVAGGTGHVGRAIVEELKGSSKHKLLVLSRKPAEKTDSDTSFLVVDYDDVDGTAKLLASNNVHTVISAIQVTSPAASASECNLVQAAAKSTTVQRFVASDWGVHHTEISPLYAVREATLAELRKTNFEWTRFVNGFFLDYYGFPYLKSYLQLPASFVLDIEHKVAAIPGTGNEPMSLIYTIDLAKFVVASLDVQNWEETTYCYSDSTTWNEFLKLIEEARGAKFTVTYDSIEKLEKGEITELPAHAIAYAFYPKERLQGLLCLFGRYVIEGKFDMPKDKALNSKFPNIQTLKVKDVVELWKGK
ncbi:hypothetical protein B7463_g7672, partial [Scytalidium lignicola]